jgi:hypothetical protein
MAMRECWERLLIDVPRAREAKTFGSRSPLWPVLHELNGHISAIAAAHRRALTTRWSAGQGSWAYVPWFAVFDPRETASPSSGLYVAYLLHAQGAALHLTASVGSGDLLLEHKARAPAVLRRRARFAGERLQKAGLEDRFVLGTVDLGSDRELPRAYSAGVAASRTYQRGHVPDDQELAADLDTLLRVYSRAIPVRGWP